MLTCSSSPRGTSARMEERLATSGHPAPLLAHFRVIVLPRNRGSSCRNHRSRSIGITARHPSESAVRGLRGWARRFSHRPEAKRGGRAWPLSLGQGSPATVSRMLDNEKYVGHWIWNKAATRRGPRTGKRRGLPNPESEWIIHEDEKLRIVLQELWERVRQRREEMRKAWPAGKRRRDFSRDQKGQQRHFPNHLLSGAVECGECGATIAQVSGNAGGYYGCLGAAKGLVRRRGCPCAESSPRRPS